MAWFQASCLEPAISAAGSEEFRRNFSLDSLSLSRETDFVRQAAYLSLGSNLGDRAANLHAALAQLEAAGRLLTVSAFYETQPVDLPDSVQVQPWFLNCVAAIETEMMPRELLTLALRIEAEMGRLRMKEKGPRNIDIDIVLFADRVVDEPGLKIPHPAMHRRRFVLEPLAEIAPDARHPALEKTAQQLLAQLPAGQTVRRLRI
jgi:2-amino-4-hydroxy-6-hydroxymethyldihydropteridine diphosphokinase